MSTSVINASDGKSHKLARKIFHSNMVSRYAHRDLDIHKPHLYQQTIKDIENQTSNETKYEVYEENGVKRLMLKKKGKNKVGLKILPVDDLFDLLYELHISNNHKIMDLLPLLKDYFVSTQCLYILRKCCVQCRLDITNDNNKAVTHKNIGIVYIIPFLTNDTTEESFRYILVYIHNITDFTVLRPLLEKNPFEIALELFKIITQYDPPESICFHSYDKLLVKNTKEHFAEMDIFNISFKLMQPNYTVPSKIIEKLHILIRNKIRKNEKLNNWPIWLSFLQKTINTDKKYKHNSHEKLITKKYRDNFCIKGDSIQIKDKISVIQSEEDCTRAKPITANVFDTDSSQDENSMDMDVLNNDSE